MNNIATMYGWPILDIPEFKGADHPYVLRAKDEKEMRQKLDELQTIVPESVDVITFPVGYKPDKPVPVSRYFVTVEFCDHDVGTKRIFLWWTYVFQGSKKEEA